jgi:hypothetical protein
MSGHGPGQTQRRRHTPACSLGPLMVRRRAGPHNLPERRKVSRVAWQGRDTRLETRTKGSIRGHRQCWAHPRGVGAGDSAWDATHNRTEIGPCQEPASPPRDPEESSLRGGGCRAPLGVGREARGRFEERLQQRLLAGRMWLQWPCWRSQNGCRAIGPLIVSFHFGAGRSGWGGAYRPPEPGRGRGRIQQPPQAQAREAGLTSRVTSAGEACNQLAETPKSHGRQRRPLRGRPATRAASPAPPRALPLPYRSHLRRHAPAF